MIHLSEGPKFEKDIKGIPKDARLKLAVLLEYLQLNPFDSRLHTKPLHEPLRGLFSFRVTREWRVIFKFTGQTDIILVRVKHRKDIYR